MQELSGNAPAPNTFSPMKYWAFISYSHSDKAWATWLHHALEKYRIPRSLVGRSTVAGEVPSRLFPVFRDQDELEASSDLNSRIRNALVSSNSLIVICSPRAAASHWVEEEIKFYRSLGRKHRIFCLVVDGTPETNGTPAELRCIPSSVYLEPGEETGSTHSEPLAADVRRGKDSKRNAMLRLVSGILGVDYDQIKQRDRQRQRRGRLVLWSFFFTTLVLLSLSYILVCDMGYAIAGSNRVRAELDRREFSLFRPVVHESEVKRTASELRKDLKERLLSQYQRGDWKCKYDAHPNGARECADIWVTAQAMTAILRCPEFEDKDFSICLKAIDEAFAPGMPVEVKGNTYGWPPSYASYTQAEPSLWLISSMALILNRHSALLTPPQRELLIKRLHYAQRAAEQYLGERGSWHMLSGTQKPDLPSIYTTALAVMALLETHASGDPWNGNPERCLALLKETVSWLIRQYDDEHTDKGWYGTMTKASGINDGLTLQIYTLLLRAHREAGITIPDHIVTTMKSHLISLNERQYDYPVSIIRPSYSYKDAQNTKRNETITIRCLWHPWSISCTSQWLQCPMTRDNASPEERVQVRRAMGHLVVTQAPNVRESLINASAKRHYIAAETLYALSSIP
jgi:hypothetical protein